MARVTVMEYERIVQLVDGRISGVLGPGRHRYRPRRTRLHRVDLRPHLLVVPGQEVLTSDGNTIRITGVVRVAIADPVVHLTASQDAQAEVYAAVQQALRVAVARRSLDELMQQHLDLSADIADQVRAAATRVGLAVEDITVRDLMLSGELRRAYAEIVLARQQGKVDLEHARSEAAALRTLANVADLLERHPTLLRLRTLQAIESAEAKLVLKQD